MKCESQYKAAKAWMALLVFVFLAWSNQASAQDQLLRRSTASETSLEVPLYKSRIIRLAAPATRVSVGNPDIADLIILRSTQLYVLGKDLGTTNVLLWDRSDNLIGTVNVEVTHDLQSLKEKLFLLLPEEKIEVYSAQRNIVLSGRVSNIVNMNAAVRIAEGYFAQLASAVESETFEPTPGSGARADKSVGEVINMMEVGGVHQVMLEVKVAEISRTELKRLNIRFNTILTGSSTWNWGGVNGGAAFPDALFAPNDVRIPVFTNPAPFGPVIDEFAPNDLFIQDKGLFASFLSANALFNVAFDAAKDNGLAKILAEPTLVAMSGERAKFVSGGEFPFVVSNGVSGNSIQFKEFGIQVGFLPVVLDSGRISLDLDIVVSELGPPINGAFFLFKRGAQTTVELADGQTLGIAGLISEDFSENVEKFPGLGSIPILGALFRSQDFQKRETELLILVTPRLVKPLVPAEVQLPTDNIVESGEFGWYLLGKLQGRVKGPGRR
ncbi:MAG: type II and III secretion system protein family protein [Proteobacteria bacterium]|nr:type II and III secretion system protein family protein [Pseudomonadota bacterium]